LLARFEPSEEFVGDLLPTIARPQWMMLAAGAMWCGYLGDARAIDFYESESRSRGAIELARHTLEEDIAFRAAHWLPPRPPLRYRASVPPAKVSEVVTSCDCAADPAFGIIVGSIPRDHRQIMTSLVQHVGGSIVFEDPGQDLAEFTGASGSELELLQRLQLAVGT
jgi:hypothetical protein